MTNNVYMHGIPKGKIIRDAVHGDIFVEDKFLKIIDTPEFQRMRRIKQLSVANIVFLVQITHASPIALVVFML